MDLFPVRSAPYSFRVRILFKKVHYRRINFLFSCYLLFGIILYFFNMKRNIVNIANVYSVGIVN